VHIKLCKRVVKEEVGVSSMDCSVGPDVHVEAPSDVCIEDAVDIRFRVEVSFDVCSVDSETVALSDKLSRLWLSSSSRFSVFCSPSFDDMERPVSVLAKPTQQQWLLVSVVVHSV
jgi:hypothetical protein